MVIPSLRGGGLERMAADLALGLQRRGWSPAMFPLGGLGVFAAELERAGIPINDSSERAPRIRGYPRRLVANLREFKPDVLHAHSGGWYPAAVARLRLGIRPLVFTDHGRYPPEPRGRALVERVLARATDRIICVTPALASYVQQFLKLPEAPPVIANGVDLARYRRDETSRARLRAEWGAKPEDVVVIAVGRLAPVKNHALLLDAAARAAAASPALRLVVVGGGQLDGELRAQARSLGIASRTTFAGFRSDVPACLAAADVFVISSTTEGLPVTLLEAFATGLPVVATAVGGIPEALGEPAAGLLVPSGAAMPMAEALSKVVTDSDLRVKLQRQSQQRGQAYSLDAMTEAYASLYGALLPGTI